MNKRKIAPYDVSVMLSEKSVDVDRRFQEILYQNHDMNMQTIISQANKLAYDLAEQTGKSLWDICLTTVPDFKYELDESDGRVGMVCNVKLTPIEFDFTHSPDYWEQKYYELRKNIESLLQEKA